MLRWTLVLRCWPAGCAAVWAAAKATVSLACAAAQAGFHSFQLGDLVDELGVAGVVVHGCESVDEPREVVGGQRTLAALDLTDQHVFDYTELNS